MHGERAHFDPLDLRQYGAGLPGEKCSAVLPELTLEDMTGMKTKTFAATLLALGIAAGAATAAYAQGPGGPGKGPGYGPGAGYGPGQGYGPGMMGGYGPGAGYGPGQGYGPGMMGGYGGGPGWGGYGPRGGGALAALNLTDDQREKVLKIQEENRSKNWDLMGKMRSEQFKLRQMAYGEKLDANAIADQQKKVDELRRQMLKSRIESRNQIAAILTKEQQQQFRQFGPWWLEDSE
jgi:Spy/CpxP family protein refolding chaperone